MKNNGDRESLKKDYSFNKELFPHFKRKDLWTSVFAGIIAGLITNHITGFHWYVILIGIIVYLLVGLGILFYRRQTEPLTIEEIRETLEMVTALGRNERTKDREDFPSDDETERVENIYYLLMASAGEYVARKVVSDKNLLTKYRRLEEKGCHILEIACIMQDLVAGNNETYLNVLGR